MVRIIRPEKKEKKGHLTLQDRVMLRNNTLMLKAIKTDKLDKVSQNFILLGR
jgi:hypothetical protein